MGTGQSIHKTRDLEPKAQALCGATTKTATTTHNWELVDCKNCLKHSPDHAAATPWTDSRADREWARKALEEQGIIGPLLRSMFYKFVSAQQPTTRGHLHEHAIAFKKIPMNELTKKYGHRRPGE